MKTYPSAIKSKLIDDFQSSYKLYDHNAGIKNSDYFSIVGNKVPIEAIIAVAGILSPEFIEYEGGIYRDLTEKGKVYLSNFTTKEDKEKFFNVINLSELIMCWEEEPEINEEKNERYQKDYKLLLAFAGIIKYYWGLKLQLDFPEQIFQFEINDQEQDFYGEKGVCLTFYEDRYL